MIRLKGRLFKTASMVDGCEKPADIGTDHAYIPIYLVQSGKCPTVIATDIKKGPLNKAARNISRYNLSDSIELRLGNGIEPIRLGECDCFIIAGMGGPAILDIIDASLDKVKAAKMVVMQPTYADGVLREYLLKNGFNIGTEALVRDSGRIYVVIRASFDGIKRQEKDIYCHIGRALFEGKDPLLKEYLEWRMRIQARIVKGLEKSRNRDSITAEKEHRLLEQMKMALQELDW